MFSAEYVGDPETPHDNALRKVSMPLSWLKVAAYRQSVEGMELS